MKAALSHLANGGLFGTFIDWRGLPTVHAAATQLLPLFKKGNGDHLNNIDLGRKGRWRSNIWVYPAGQMRATASKTTRA